ncbi:hypothetical protein ACFOEP_04690 [Microbacterium amylolyticum]
MSAYRASEELRDGHVPSIAFDLDVTPELVHAYQQLLARASLIPQETHV